jgi:hypothetical protein
MKCWWRGRGRGLSDKIFKPSRTENGWVINKQYYNEITQIIIQAMNAYRAIQTHSCTVVIEKQ